MSLPFRFSTVEDYVKRTIEMMQQCSPKFTHLNVGKYYLRGSELEDSHIISLFRSAERCPHIFEISLCGITLDDREAFLAWVKLLIIRKWKKLAFNCCHGQSIRALSFPVLLECIRINNCRMVEEDFFALGRNIKQNSLLAHLEIFEEKLSYSHAARIEEGLALTKSLRILELSYCQFDNESVTSLASGLYQNQSIESLFLPGCELDDQQIALIVRSLLHHPNLKHLKTFRNHCGGEGAAAFASLLAQPTPRSVHNSFSTETRASLLTLDLSYQQFERAKKLNLGHLATSLAENRTLIHLALAFNKLNDSDAEMLALGLRNNNVLRELDLRANNIRDNGTIALAENLVRSSALKKLYLFGNPLGVSGGIALLEAIRGNTEMELLNMDYTTAGYEKIQYFSYLNKAGRRLLRNDELNPALWPVVLARTKGISLESRGICSEADLIYELVRAPALLTSN